MTFQTKLFNVAIRGVTPLLQHRFATEDCGKKKKRSGEEKRDDEVEKALYRNSDWVICQPARHIECAMIQAAKMFKVDGKGKKTFKSLVGATVEVHPELIPHKFQKYTVEESAVKIGPARILRRRPKFDPWELHFQIKTIDEQLPIETLKDILDTAGVYCGLGDYRPGTCGKFGRFAVIKFEPAKE